MKLEARIRTADGSARAATVERAGYDEARAALEQQVGDGERLLSIRRTGD